MTLYNPVMLWVWVDTPEGEKRVRILRWEVDLNE